MNDDKIKTRRHRAMMRPTFLIYLFVPIFVFAMGLCATVAWAQDEEIPFDVAEIYFELNNTDGDLGIHSLIDGDPWKRLKIEDPRERQMLNIFVQGRLRKQGLTELFFESAEPTFDELSPRRFFRRFPQGEYEIEGTTLDGEELESTATLTHLLPAPPQNVMVNMQAVPEDCEEGPVPVVSDEGDVVISWDAVTLSHPELGITNAPITVVRYQVVVEQEDFEAKITMDLPPDVYEVELPAVFTELGGEYKLEILVREASGNQTAIETCFEIEE